ncbi:MAG: divalent-cation tolerance protein CutA [Acidobacteria bacterium]|nr:divalent-cation tolerance protein CutA [Acidobacteriota bacterium]MCB9397042.1 divalent-cation tolerance protein CutA [Acidobacteriota bacterium]
MSHPLLVLVTAGSEQQALTIAEELIQQELAACVNLLPAVRSIYRFKGKVFDDEEILLFIKTTEALFEDVAELVSQLHTYEVPEIMAFKADFTKNNVLKWLDDSVRISP